MDVVDRLRAAAEDDGWVGTEGPVRLSLRPGLAEAQVAAVQARYPVPLPAELTALMAVTGGVDGLLGLDLVGTAHPASAPRLLPAGLPIAADGSGNVWLLDLTPDTTEVAPVFYLSHDPAVLLYQAPDLATFVEQALARLAPPHASPVDEVRADRPYAVWRTQPGAVPWREVSTSTDVALREFALTLDPAWSVVDLRRRDVGMGVAWGHFGPQTRFARHGWERIFGYAPHVEARRTWRRLWRKERV